MKTQEVLSVRSILESNTLLNALTEDQMNQLSQTCKMARCRRGEPIWINHQDAGFCGLVGAGFVKMVKSCPSGVDATLEIMGPGELFGLLGTIDGQGCPLMACTLTDVVYLKISKAEIKDIYRANHVLKDRLVRKTTLRMHQKLDYMSRLTSSRVEERIAAVLFILAESYGCHVGNSIRLDVPLTRQQVAEIAGTTTETTIRVFSRWTQRELVDTDHQFITILDPVRLDGLLHMT